MELDEFLRKNAKRLVDSSFKVWEEIQTEIIRNLGLFTNLNIFFYIDSNQKFLNVNACGKTIIDKEENLQQNIDFLKDTGVSLEITFNIKVSKRKKTKINTNDGTYFVIDDEEFYDYGSIHYLFEGSCSVQNIDEIKKNFLLEMCREARYAYNKNVNEIDIYDKDMFSILEIDSNIDQIIAISKIENISLEESMKYFDNLSLENKKTILKLIKENIIERV